MRALIDSETQKQLDKFGSVVRLCDIVRPKMDETTGMQKEDRQGRPLNDYAVRAELYEDKGNGKVGRQWCAAEAGDRPEALKKVLIKAKTQSRPASTAEDLAQQLEDSTNRIAQLERELEQKNRGEIGSRKSNVSGSRDRPALPEETPAEIPTEPAKEPVAQQPEVDPLIPTKRGRGRPPKVKAAEDSAATEPQAS